MSTTDLKSSALRYLPGGVNSPVRAWQAVGGDPLFFERGKGAWLYDTEGRAYIDYVGAWGPAILGHAHPAINTAIAEQLDHGLGFGATHRLEIQLAALLVDWIPSLDCVRLVNSGTEAAMSAVRLARAATGADGIIKFNGGYHGHADSFLAQSKSVKSLHSKSSSPGVPQALAEYTYCAEYNDLASVAEIMQRQKDGIACVIVEPVAGNMNCILSADGFLQGLRELCDHYGSLLIFDEVMTGLRISPGTAQARYKVTPDLTLLGKIIGGGLPVGAFGGRKELMEMLAPSGPVYQAGTQSGNPVAMAAGITALEICRQPGFYQALEKHTAELTSGLKSLAEKNGIDLCISQAGGMFGIMFTDQPQVSNLQQLQQCDVQRFIKFFRGCLAGGIFFAPSPYEAAFISAAHDRETTDRTLAVADEVFARISTD